MTLLQLVNATKQFGSKILFDSATFSINEGEHVGVIGPNGAGKTTLFKILVGREQLDSGEIVKANGLRLGYLEQESDWAQLDQTPEEFFLSRGEHCWPIWEVKQWGQRLGLDHTLFATPFRQFSGGFRMRFKLLDLISQDPHLMLLDEPTNFLDLETLLVLETFLRDFKGAFLLISHDREFLKQVADHTLEVEAGDIQKFPGTIDDYFETKSQLREHLEKQQANRETQRKHLQDFVDRFRAKATKAKQAQSRVKQLQKMETIDIKPLPVRAQIQIPNPSPTGKEIIQLEQVNVGYQADLAVLQKVHLQMRRGDHIGVVGINGAGKSTLLKTLAQQLAPLTGNINLGYQVTTSYYAQHSADQLRPEETVLESLLRSAHASVTQQEVLNLAGALLFSGENVSKKVRILSGGEKSRVALGQVLLQKNPLLLLDEPTNHLDFDTVESLTQALANFEGSLVVVSHDRSFIRRVADKILEIRDGKVQFYPGTYDEYIWSLEKGVLAEINLAAEAKSAKVKTSGSGRSSAAAMLKAQGDAVQVGMAQRVESYEERKRNESERRKLEKESLRLEKLMQTLAQSQSDLNERLATAPTIEVAKLSSELAKISEDLVKTEDTYLEVLGRLDILK
jgi:ATP-binding cassette subfamily F protein 3